jgi:hypothetical protein
MTEKQYRSTYRLFVEFQILKSFEAQAGRMLQANKDKPFLAPEEIRSIEAIKAEVQITRETMAVMRAKPKAGK